MSLDAVELRRKGLHIGMGLFALLLRCLVWQEAVLAALAALAFNLFVLPRKGGGALLRPRDIERGFPIGILLYPIVVLVLILLFRHHLEIAAAGWGFLAFGDGFATLAGKAIGGLRLPWNREKSWAGLVAYILCGAAGAAGVWAFVADRPLDSGLLTIFALAALAGAIVESLPSELDDNILPPLVGAGVVFVLTAARPDWVALTSAEFLRNAGKGAALNLAVALATGILGMVRPSGAAAGFVLGTLVFACGGSHLYALLWIFFVLGTISTRFGRKRKEALGKAEEAGGRRGAANVLANVSVPAFFCVAAALDPARRHLYLLGAAAALATALMDTVGTEVGQAVRSRTVLLPDFHPVPPGTDGAVSVAGTLAGLVAGGFVAVAALDLAVVAPLGALFTVAGAVVGTVTESLLGRAGAPWRLSNGHVLNFLNTLVGALTAIWLGGRF
ncbi:MAG: DUF92 domain-containing protein [Thermoanaerobaculia bacterium]